MVFFSGPYKAAAPFWRLRSRPLAPRSCAGSANVEDSPAVWEMLASGKESISGTSWLSRHLRCLVPKAMKRMAFGTRNLKYCIPGPAGYDKIQETGCWPCMES